MGTNIRQCNEAKMLRYQIFLAYGVAMAAIWYAALQQKAEIADRLGISNGQACCPAACGQCGGGGCGQAPGGGSQCCKGQVINSGVACATDADTACVIPS